MKKYNYAFAVLLVTLLGICSCSSEIHNTNNDIKRNFEGKTVTTIKNRLSKDKMYVWLKVGAVWRFSGDIENNVQYDRTSERIDKWISFTLDGLCVKHLVLYKAEDFLAKKQILESDIKEELIQASSRSVPMKVTMVKIERVDFLKFYASKEPYYGDKFPTPEVNRMKNRGTSQLQGAKWNVSPISLKSGTNREPNR